MTVAISVVSPLYRSRRQVAGLVTRLGAALDQLGEPWELVLVDDGCPEDSGSAAVAAAGASGWRGGIGVLRLGSNVGQAAAVLIGLSRARGQVVVVMDADLQDRPEDVVALVTRLRSGGCDVVCAGRRGRYASASRRLTGLLFRSARAALTLGRVPPDAGLFLAARREVIERVLALGDPQVHLVSALAHVGAGIASVPLERDRHPSDETSYTWIERLSMAASALVVVTPLYGMVRRHRQRRWSAPGEQWLARAEIGLEQGT